MGRRGGSHKGERLGTGRGFCLRGEAVGQANQGCALKEPASLLDHKAAMKQGTADPAESWARGTGHQGRGGDLHSRCYSAASWAR